MHESWQRYISVDSTICHGKPVFRGTRIPLVTVLELLENGMKVEDILRGFPSLNQKAIKAAIHYAIVKIQQEEFIPLAASK